MTTNLSIKKEAGVWIEEEVKEVALNLLTLLSIKTPVDEGTAVYNWKVSIGSTDGRTRKTVSNGESNRNAMVSKETPKIERYDLGQVLYIQNNLPYISRLNNGYSDQAPKRFVETAIEQSVRIK